MADTVTAKKGYVNGSDMLVSVAGKPTGHATSHKVTFDTTTKERAVKPVATATATASLFSEKSVTGLSITITAEGLSHYEETEHGPKAVLVEWAKGQSVEVKCFYRSKDTTPYLSGKFVITKVDIDASAKEDVTYSLTLENDGAPDVFDMTKADA